jgi:hypothetical protein
VSTTGISHSLTRAVEPGLSLAWVAVAGGIVVSALSLALQPADAWHGVLTAALFGTTLALGGALFVAIQAAASARWWLPFGSVPLTLARTLPAPAVALAVCFLFGLQALYPWARPAAVEASHLLKEKAAWLNEPLFLARALVVFVLWFSMIGVLRQRFAAFSREASAANGRRLGRVAVGFLVVYAITNAVASWDWGMSLEPEWFSTMYSVYVFAGTFLGGIAAVALLSLMLERAGLLVARLPPKAVHDLGKLLFAFATFWAYIWFCQYMLIWYANLPEETGHYAARLSGGWSMLFYLNPILNWVVPFVVLLPAGTKRHAPTLAQVAIVVLLGRWLDCYLLVAPAAGPAPGFLIAAVAATVAVLGGMGLIFRRILAREAIDPVSGVRPPGSS